MDESSVLEHLAQRSGVPDRIALHRALVVTLRAVRGRIARPLALRLVASLPATIAIALRAPGQDPPEHVDELFEQVHVVTGLRLGAAREVVQSVLSFVGSLLEDDLRRELAAELPTEWGALVERRDVRARVGGVSPIAIVHRGSIAASDDPHADTRLSSAQGVRAAKISEARPGAGERSLAEGRPGAGERSLAEARPRR